MSNNCNVCNTSYPQFYTVQDIMNILHIGKTKAYQLFASSGFPATTIGREKRIEKTAFEKWYKDYEGRRYVI